MKVETNRLLSIPTEIQIMIMAACETMATAEALAEAIIQIYAMSEADPLDKHQVLAKGFLVRSALHLRVPALAAAVCKSEHLSNTMPPALPSQLPALSDETWDASWASLRSFAPTHSWTILVLDKYIKEWQQTLPQNQHLSSESCRVSLLDNWKSQNETLTLRNDNLVVLPPLLKYFAHVKHLFVAGMPFLTDLGAGLGEMKRLQSLDIDRASSLQKLPASLGQAKLESLKIRDMQTMRHLGCDFSACKTLKTVTVQFSGGDYDAKTLRTQLPKSVCLEVEGAPPRFWRFGHADFSNPGQ